jgi:V8-like Glu-specific endopeptidase
LSPFPYKHLGAAVVRLVVDFGLHPSSCSSSGKRLIGSASGILLGKYVLTSKRAIASDSGSDFSVHAIHFTRSSDATIEQASLNKWGACDSTHIRVPSGVQQIAGTGGRLWATEDDVLLLSVTRTDSHEFLNQFMPDAISVATDLNANDTLYVMGYPAQIPEDKLHSIRNMFFGFQKLVCSYGMQDLSELTSASASCAAGSLSPSQQPLQYLKHLANTVGGMCGGPIFNQRGELVGLHVGGCEDTYNVMYPIYNNKPLLTVLKTLHLVADSLSSTTSACIAKD